MHDWHDSAAMWTGLREEWQLRPGVTYLNHGSFGPSPRAVRQVRQDWLDRHEAEPMDFFVRQLESQLQTALDSLANFVGTTGQNLTFLPNSTSAMNVVAGSVPLSAGDEILCTSHEYGAVAHLADNV